MAEPKKSSRKSQELLTRVRTRVKAMLDADRENRQLALDDLKFVHVPGEQWDETTRIERGERACYEFNKLRVTIKRIVNDMRANRPQGKVRAVEDNDKDTSEVLEGLCRNIWNTSDGDTVIDYAAEYQVGGGMGAWRVATKYSHDTAFDQDIVVEAIKNPFCLYADPACEDPLKRDAWDWALVTRMSKRAFETRYPAAQASDFDGSEFDDEDEWGDGEFVRVCEYWYKEPVTRTLVLLSDGATAYAEEIEAQADNLSARGVTVLREREVKTHKICSVICSGNAVLEGPNEWAGSQFPFVLVYGEHLVLDGKTHWFGITRFAKDAQRAINVARTATIETIALAPQAKFWATPAQALGHTDRWAEAHKKLYPFMLYNADPQAGGPPQRMGGADVPVALLQEAAVATDDLKSVTGIFDNSLGAQGNESSGRAILARQKQGEIATFNYSDNLAKGIRRTWEILIDLVPRIYDTERSVRILGADGAEKFVRVNSASEDGQAVNDLTRGRFDVTVTVGPSFSTQRQEAAEVYGELATRDPNLMGVAGDLVFKSMDLPFADEIAERYKTILPPPVQQALQQAEGQTLPPEVLSKLAQADQMMQQVQQQGQLVQQAAQELDGQRAEVEAAAAKLNAEKVALEADFQKKIAEIVKREAQFMLDQSQAGADDQSRVIASDREALSAQVAEAVAALQQQAAVFMTQAVGVIEQIQAAKAPQVVVADAPPRSKRVTMQIGNRPVSAIIEELPN